MTLYTLIDKILAEHVLKKSQTMYYFDKIEKKNPLMRVLDDDRRTKTF